MGVYKRNDKWEVRLQIRGRKYYRQVPEASNKAQAKLAEATIRREIYEARYGKEGEGVGAHDFADFAHRLYLPHKKDIVSPLTYAHDFNKVNVLCGYFKGKCLRDLSQITIEAFRRQLLTKPSHFSRPIKPATAKQYINTLSQVLEFAVENDMLRLNPCKKIKWARGSTISRRNRVMTANEEQRLMPLLEGETRAAVLLALNTGMRKVSILGLRTYDVDFMARTATFTKKGGSRQVAPLNQTALAVLRELTNHPTREGFLFHNRRGHNLSSSNGFFRKAARAADITDLHFHDLRHTFATRLRLHADAFTVRDLMGHTKVDTTDIYVTAQVDEMRRAVERLAPQAQAVEVKLEVSELVH